MHIHLADQYSPGSSFLHKLDPRTKVILALLLIFSIALLPPASFAIYALFALIIFSLARRAGIGLAFLLKRSLVALPFAMAALTLPFTVPGNEFANLPILGTVTVEGLVRFMAAVVKSWLSVQVAVLLVTLTPFQEILWGLGKLRMPRVLIAIISFMYRYLFVLSDEALRLLRARSARGAVIDGYKSGGGVIWRGKVAGAMAGSLLVRSLERSERIYFAMLARGYKGELFVAGEQKLNSRDTISLIAGLAICITALIAGAVLFR